MRMILQPTKFDGMGKQDQHLECMRGTHVSCFTLTMLQGLVTLHGYGGHTSKFAEATLTEIPIREN